MSLESKCLAGVVSLPIISISVLFGNVLVSEYCQDKNPSRMHSSHIKITIPEVDMSYKNDDVDENGCKIDPTFVPWKNEEKINTARKTFIQNSYGRIVKEQNDHFELDNFKAPPYSIKYAKQGGGIPRDGGIYDFKTGQITFGLSLGKKGGWADSLDEDYNCYAISRAELEDAADYNIRHEVGHAYFYAQAKKLGLLSLFQEDEHNYESQEGLAAAMVVEGFAEYMAYRGNPTSDIFRECPDPTLEYPSPYDWKTPLDVDNNNFIEHHMYIYGCGYVLVAPILDEDFHNGLEYLLRNPPTMKDLKDLPKYQEKALQTIEIGNDLKLAESH